MRQQFSALNQLSLELDFPGVSGEILYWGYFDGKAWWRNYLHIHSFFEACYVLSGLGHYVTNNKTYQLKPNDLFIARPNERHEIVSSQADPLEIYFWSFTLVPKPASQCELNNLFDAFAKHKTFLAESPRVFALLESLCQEITLKQAGYSHCVESLAKQLLIETARAFAGSQPVPSDSGRSYQNAAVNTILHYLRDNYHQALTLKEIAAQVHLSERHMSRIFKRETGSSIKRYLSQLRMNIAKQRLLSSQQSVSDVAFEIGFEDTRYFSTAFRKATGLSPTKFREQGGTTFL